MKRLIFLLSFLFVVFTSHAQTYTSVFEVPNSSTQFGRPIPVGKLIVDTTTDRIWRLTSSASSTTTLLTASKVPFPAEVGDFLVDGSATISKDVTIGSRVGVVGLNSFTQGNSCEASGLYSHAGGLGTTASGLYSHAEGDNTVASGDQSHAEGFYTVASGYGSHAEGYQTVASGYYSHAGGKGVNPYPVIALGSVSFNHSYREYSTPSVVGATGNYSAILGGKNNNATAEGATVIGGDGCVASGVYSHAGGWGNVSSGHGSYTEGGIFDDHGPGSEPNIASNYSAHAEGVGTVASGHYSHAEGYHTVASGYASHAEGNYTVASGDASHAEGRVTVASGPYSHAGGKGDLTYPVIALGKVSFNHSCRENSAPSVVGATGDHSAILGGINNSSTAKGSAVIAGNNITNSKPYTLATSNLLVVANGSVGLTSPLLIEDENGVDIVTIKDNGYFDFKDLAFITDDIVAYGKFSGRRSTGSGNAFIGNYSGYSNKTGSLNLFIGDNAGYSNTTGYKNVFIGYHAGYNELGSNKLYIESSNSLTPLIYGEFDNDLVRINGDLDVIGTFTVNSLVETKESTTLLDDAIYDLPSSVSGHLRVMYGDNEGWVDMYFASDGTYNGETSLNITFSSVDGDFCVYDTGTNIRIENKTGVSKTVKIIANY